MLQRVFDAQLKTFQSQADAAEKLLAYGEAPRNKQLEANELAAYTMVANVLLNLDETVTKE